MKRYKLLRLLSLIAFCSLEMSLYAASCFSCYGRKQKPSSAVTDDDGQAAVSEAELLAIAAAAQKKEEEAQLSAMVKIDGLKISKRSILQIRKKLEQFQNENTDYFAIFITNRHLAKELREALPGEVLRMAGRHDLLAETVIPVIRKLITVTPQSSIEIISVETIMAFK